MTHLVDNRRDRSLGAVWERRFCTLALEWGRALSPQQLSQKEGAARWYRRENGHISPYLLPDVTIWSAPGEHHEIKHKDATRFGCYGLEAYRLEALAEFASETQQDVLYTIHDWRLAGAKRSDEEMPNLIDHWRTVLVTDLTAKCSGARVMPTWLNGSPTEVLGYYWPTEMWRPLDEWWVY